MLAPYVSILDWLPEARLWLHLVLRPEWAQATWCLDLGTLYSMAQLPFQGLYSLGV